MCVDSQAAWSGAGRGGDVSQQQGQEGVEPLSQHGAPGPQQEFIERDGPQVEGLLQRDGQTPAPGPGTASLVPGRPGRYTENITRGDLKY